MKQPWMIIIDDLVSQGEQSPHMLNTMQPKTNKPARVAADGVRSAETCAATRAGLLVCAAQRPIHVRFHLPP